MFLFRSEIHLLTGKCPPHRELYAIKNLTLCLFLDHGFFFVKIEIKNEISVRARSEILCSSSLAARKTFAPDRSVFYRVGQ